MKRREIDRDAHVLNPVVLPVAQLPARAGDHPASQWRDLLRLFGQRTDDGRGNESEMAMLPAQQRFDANDAPVAVVLGLVGEKHLA